jgi:hypothetical protein
MALSAAERAGMRRPGEIDPASYGTREDYLEAVENERRAGVFRRRAYYAGRQYDENNWDCLEKLSQVTPEGGYSEKDLARALALWHRELPEHLRLHEYSTQIAESVDFIAGRLSAGFAVEIEDDTTRTVLEAALDASPELASSDDETQLNVVNVVREACKAGDTAVLLRWNPIEQTGWYEFWDSDTVELRFKEDRPDEIEQAIVWSVDWRPGPDGVDRMVRLKRLWIVRNRVMNAERVEVEPGVPEERRLECAEEVYLEVDGEEVLDKVVWWGVPFVPWWPVRALRRSLRSLRGDSVIGEQAMKTADRYNAVEQVSWLIARYNSHANLVVTGDAALAIKPERLAKDVADVLTFPGGTSAIALSLPTDPQMIEHQRAVLKESLYASMGLSQIDQQSLQGLGGVTGYALEILNEKTGQTFAQIRTQLVSDLKKLFTMMLDAVAYWQLGVLDLELTPPGVGDAGAQVEIDDLQPASSEESTYSTLIPEQVFPNREIKIQMGSGYIVDDVRIRDDYTSKLISQEEALRLRGYKPDEIEDIVAEQAESAQKALEMQAAAFGTGTEGTQRPGTRAGSSTGSTNRQSA